MKPSLALASLRSRLPLLRDRAINQTPFEKDDSENKHIEFLASASNLRNVNFSIPPLDNCRVHLIAGNIIPAISTSTSLVVGASCIEFLKLCLGKPREDHRNSYFNLGLGIISFLDTIEIEEADQIDPTHILEIHDDITLGELLDRINTKFKQSAEDIDCGTTTLYMDCDEDYNSNLTTKVRELIPVDQISQDNNTTLTINLRKQPDTPHRIIYVNLCL